jgi:hypothetical protein
LKGSGIAEQNPGDALQVLDSEVLDLEAAAGGVAVDTGASTQASGPGGAARMLTLNEISAI